MSSMLLICNASDFQVFRCLLGKVYSCGFIYLTKNVPVERKSELTLSEDRPANLALLGIDLQRQENKPLTHYAPALMGKS